MINVSNVVKRFDGFTALDGLNLNVPQGSIYGLVGPNGSGKTTIIRHLTGMYRQDSGEITIAGEPVYENPSVKAKIACIPDELYFFPSANIREMKNYYAGIYPKFDTDRFEKLHEAFPLDGKRQIRRFSKGMQKQAAFWLALSMRPEILILDEPVDGLDPVMRRQVWSLMMSDVAENGTTVLVSSHNLRELEDVCDHVGIIHHGRTLIERSLSELQGNIAKVQFVLDEDQSLPGNLNVLHESRVGKVRTIIVRGKFEDVDAKMASISPLFYDIIPLTLEEVFIYELGGEEYEFKDILF